MSTVAVESDGMTSAGPFSHHSAGSNPARRASVTAASASSGCSIDTGWSGPLGPRAQSWAGSTIASAVEESSHSERLSNTGCDRSAARASLASPSAAARSPLINNRAEPAGSSSARSLALPVSTDNTTRSPIRTGRPPRSAAIPTAKVSLKATARLLMGRGLTDAPTRDTARARDAPSRLRLAAATPTYDRGADRDRMPPNPVRDSSTR